MQSTKRAWILRRRSFTRVFDQIRMSQYSQANVKFVGWHAGVSIGEDDPFRFRAASRAAYMLAPVL